MKMKKPVVSPWDINFKYFSFTHIIWEQISLFVSDYTLSLYIKEKNFALKKGGEEAYENIPLELVINLS